MLALTYSPQTPLHAVSAPIKLMALCAITTALFIIPTGWANMVLGGAALALYAAMGSAFLRAGLRTLYGLWPFVVVLGLWHGWQGDWDGGILIVARLITAVAFANLVTMTTPLQDMIACLVRLLHPFRRLGLNPNAVSLAIAMMIRFIPVFMARAEQLKTAHRARSHRSGRWAIIFPLALGMLDDADTVAEALRARGGITPKD